MIATYPGHCHFQLQHMHGDEATCIQDSGIRQLFAIQSPHPAKMLVRKLVADGNPSWRQATFESVNPQRSSHTVPHCPLRKISNRPEVKELLVTDPLDNLRAPVTVNNLYN